MSETSTTNPQSAESRSNVEEMAKYGIVCEPVDVFYIGGYRYSNLCDAIAQSKRMAATE
ncbi:MAG: hypothetical protein ISP41_15955 [Alphaproteobacteria bacterium]|jgi:hypothetical protein|nr:hypothetical protein [Alphaproteobacteria bacterium]